ncbi:MAG: citrate/2-methylcitrate synthase, partial [Candidatus Promineifilaceae bacterium]
MDNKPKTNNNYFPGLQGVIAAETFMSSVDGQRGELIIAGFPVETLAKNASFEEVVYLLWHGRLPSPAELASLRGDLAAQRALPAPALDLLREAARRTVKPMDALRMAAATLDLDATGDLALALVARFPTIVAAYWRFLHGQEPLEPDAALGHAANYLYMLSGERPT